MDEFEKKHVHDVYDAIADEFNDSRYRIWPSVQAFVDKALSGLKVPNPKEISEFKKLNVLEVGCGNGKNLEYISKTYPNVHVSGCDMCEKFVEITSKKGIDCCVADNLKLPYAPGSFDVVLSVAVIHHFSTQERRIQAIQELFRVLKPGGKLFIQVWALEQPPKSKRHFATQDEFVPWKGTSPQHTAERKRYYHLFKKGELEKLAVTVGKHGAEIIDSGYDSGNWFCAVLKK